MNTEEVTEMIDAITEGEDYTLSVTNEGESGDRLNLEFTADRLTFTDCFDSFVDVKNARAAREIAGALIAWASRKDGGLPGGAISDLRDMFSQGNVKRPSHSEEAPQPGSREIWYRQNVGNMTPETKQRNLKDLEGIYNDLHPNSSEAIDTQKAIEILRASLFGEVKSLNHNTPPENCTKPQIWHTSGTHRRKHYESGECSDV